MFTRAIKAIAGLFRRQTIVAKYDAAQSSGANKNHWTLADGLSAAQANNPAVRKVLRDRSRYETANNCWLRGMLNTLADDTIGTGPRLQMQSGDSDVDTAIERAFSRWCKAIGLPEKLRTMRIAKGQDGEAFALAITNQNLLGPVKLDIRLLEAEQVASPLAEFRPNYADGIEFDRFGNPTKYTVIPHPGDMTGLNFSNQNGTPYEAKDVFHLFRCDRPGQVRGVPEITPALVLMPQLRRFTLATIGAAEFAASPAGVLSTTVAADDSAGTDSPWQEINYEHRGLMVVPDNTTLTQLEAKHPTTTYAMFCRALITEAGRCLSMPYVIAAGDASMHNYSSGRMDHQNYLLAINVERSYWETKILDRLFAMWLDEALLADESLRKLGTFETDHTWYWDRREHVDPSKESQSQVERLNANLTTLAAEYAKDGKDWEPEIRQRAKEVELCTTLKLPTDQAAPKAKPNADAQDAQDDAVNAEITRRQMLAA